MNKNMNKDTDSLESRTIKKVRNRIIPYLMLLYLVAFIDRQNLGFASLEMNKDLAISSEQFGVISGIFFIGYFLFEVPSNIWLQKFGARKWIARILLSWGLVATLTGFAQNEVQLYILRFLLGIAEAGFFPGIILYLTYWFPKRERARMNALFMVAIPLSSLVSSPISGLILDYINWFNVSSWRWLFIIEGIPAIILGIVTFFILIDRPKYAKWLSTEEKNWLNKELSREHQETMKKNPLSIKQVALNVRVWQLTVVCLAANVGVYGMGIWAPQIISDVFSNYSNTAIGFVTMIPFGFGVIFMVLNGRHSDYVSERRFHAAIALFLSGVSLIVITITTNAIFSMILITIIVAGIYSYYGPFFTLPTLFLSEATAAVGIAIINSVGNLGGVIGPYIIGWSKSATGSSNGGFYGIAIALFVAVLMLIFIRKENQVKG